MVWRAKTPEGMVALGRHIGEKAYYLHCFHDDGGRLTYVSESEALWLTLELAPEKMSCI